MALFQNGSSGSEVSKIQQALVDKGYSVGSAGVDGIYGSATANAVKQYQQDNGLDVDGIVGDQTYGSLFSSTPTTTTSTSTSTTSPYITGVSDETTSKLKTYESGYQPSATVTEAENYLKSVQASKPSEYVSKYDADIQSAYNNIINREDFSYDVNNDVLYNQYKEQYQTLGKQAMEDTIGQASALTGGYGSTYGQAVGQQQYNAYLQNLNDVIPELYENAYSKYQDETDELYNRYNTLVNQEEQDYSRYQDQLSAYNTDYANAYNAYADARDTDYNKYQDELNYWQNKASLEADDYWTNYSANQSSSSSSSGSSKSSSSDDTNYTTKYKDALELLNNATSRNMLDYYASLIDTSDMTTAQEDELLNTYNTRYSAFQKEVDKATNVNDVDTVNKEKFYTKKK